MVNTGINADIPLPFLLFVGSGVNTVESTAFGITETKSGFREALRTVFSLLQEKEQIIGIKGRCKNSYFSNPTVKHYCGRITLFRRQDNYYPWTSPQITISCLSIPQDYHPQDNYSWIFLKSFYSLNIICFFFHA